MRKLRAPQWSNCLLWALARLWKRGGYLLVRRSGFGHFPHFLWSRDLRRVWSYCPLQPSRRLLPPPLFRGYVKGGP
jgi:hypothetical protein